MLDQFLEKVEHFRARHSLSEHSFGLRFCCNGGWYSAVRAGRQVRGVTMAKITERMTAYDELQKEQDRAALALIERCGFVTLGLDGKPCLESNIQIDDATFQRLVADGILIPNGDALFGAPSQTYRPAHGA